MADIKTALIIDLEGNVVGEIQNVDNKLKDTGTTAGKTGSRFKSFFTSMTTGFQRVGRTIFSLKGALAGLGLGAVVGSSLNEADKIHKLTIKLGDSAENISSMRHVAQLSGLDFDQMMTSWQRMGRRIAEVATEGGGEAASALDRLKLSAEKLNQLPATDQFMAIADAIQRISSIGERQDIMGGIFDSEGVSNLQAMTAGAEGLSSMMQEAIDQGYVLSGQQVEQAAAANDVITKLTNTLTGAVQQIAVQLAPQIEKLVGFLVSEQGTAAIQSFAEGLSWIVMHLSEISQAIILVMAASALPAFVALLALPGGLPIVIFASFVALIVTFRDEIKAAWEGLRNFEIAIGPFKVSIGGVIDSIIGYFKNLATAITERIAAWKAFAAKVAEVGEQVIGYVKKMVDGIKSELVDRFNGIVDAVKEKVDAVTGFFKDMWDKVTGNSYVPDMIDDIKFEFGRLDDVMVDPAEEATSAVAGFFEDMGRKIGSTFKDILTGAVSLKDGLKGLVAEIGDMITDKIVNAAWDQFTSYLPASTQEFLGYSGGSDNGGSGNNLFTTAGKAAWKKWGANAVANYQFGAASTTSASPGALGSVKGPSVLNYGNGAYGGSAFSGQGATAVGNGYGGGAVGGNVASGGTAGYGALAGPAIVAAIGAWGMSRNTRKQEVATNQFLRDVGTGISEQLNEVIAFRGAINGMEEDATRMFLQMDEGWASTVIALKEANLITGSQPLLYEQLGKSVIRVSGNVQQVTNALKNAQITGFQFAGSLETAIEKGNGLRVSIAGNAEVIKQALQDAAHAGVGAFRDLETTGTGVSATLTGDMAQWKKVLQEFVNGSVQSAISGVNSLGGSVASTTRRFLELASASSQVRVIAGSGGRAGQVDNATGQYAYGGVSRGAQLAWVSEGPYPVEAHIPMLDGSSIPVKISSPTSSTSNNAAFGSFLVAQQETNERLANLEAYNERMARAGERAARRADNARSRR